LSLDATQPWCLGAVLALAAGAWVSLWLTAQDLVRLRRRIDPRDVAAVVGLFAAALAVRWILPAHTLIHENKHGYVYDPYLPLDRGLSPAGPGSVVYGHIVLLKLYTYLTPLGREPLFEMNVLFSALAVAGMYALGRLVFEERLAAWSAACLLLLQPLAILMAPTEECLVSATGLCLTGMPLLWFGAREARWSPLVAGACLVTLGATSREVTLPLAALVAITLLAAKPPGRPASWARAAVALGLSAAALAPFAVGAWRSARAAGGAPSFVGLPHLPFAHGPGGWGRDARWVGWRAPYIPGWMAWLGLAGVVALTLHAARRPGSRRAALVGVGGLVLAQAAGGLVAEGWFTSNLRHQLFAMAMLMLPAGWLLGQLARLPLRARWLRAAPWLIAPALGVGMRLASPSGSTFDAPMVEEYRFFHEAIQGLPRRARAVVLARGPSRLEQLPEEFFWREAPGWETVSSRALGALVREGSELPTYLFLDRTCFLNTACFDPDRDCRLPEVRDAQPVLPSPYGRLHRSCDAALRAAPWALVARREILAASDPAHDLPSVDPAVSIAVLVWDGRPAAR
jgi:hypothetical protein